MSSIKWRVQRLEHQVLGAAQMTEQEGIRCLRDVLCAAGSGTPSCDIQLLDLAGTKAGTFLTALREAGQCVA